MAGCGAAYSIDKSPIDSAARGFAAAFDCGSGLVGTAKPVSATRTDSMFDRR